jgi:hypothetical protein
MCVVHFEVLTVKMATAFLAKLKKNVKVTQHIYPQSPRVKN